MEEEEIKKKINKGKNVALEVAQFHRSEGEGKERRNEREIDAGRWRQI